MAKSGEEEIYSVPQEVLRSISKNFTELQQEFEKAADDSKGDICNVVVDTDADTSTDQPKHFLRIKRVRSFGEDPPKGTVARILVQVKPQDPDADILASEIFLIFQVKPS